MHKSIGEMVHVYITKIAFRPTLPKLSSIGLVAVQSISHTRTTYQSVPQISSIGFKLWWYLAKSVIKNGNMAHSSELGFNAECTCYEERCMACLFVRLQPPQIGYQQQERNWGQVPLHILPQLVMQQQSSVSWNNHTQ